MATQIRKRPVTNRTAATRRSAKARKKGSETLAGFVILLVFIVGILFCLSFLTFLGYQTVAASSFFGVKTININGINRLPKDDIEKMVSRRAEKSGVWNANLAQIKEDVEKFTLVKSAVVSRILPDGLRVNINERVPRAVVRINSGEYWADEDAVILGAVGKGEGRPPFFMLGWDENKTDKAVKDNQERVKIYLKMLDEWQDFELAKRVSAVKLVDLQKPQALVPDSGETVTITLPRENFGKRLQKGLEIIVGRGKEIESVNLSNQKETLGFRVK
jgi:cell division septal protein FtsQ